MHTALGIFRQPERAGHAIQVLLSHRVPPHSVIYLTGDQAENKLESMPTSDTGAEGMGKTMGAYLGAVLGAGAGVALGSVAASLFVPGVGTIFAAGLGAAAALGLGGATAGASLGPASEDAMEPGVPKDDVFFYRSLLKHHLTVVLVKADTEEHASAARRLLAANGSEDVEAARKGWRAQPEASRPAS